MFKYILTSIMSVLVTTSAYALSPLEGTWFNSYCSRIDINVDTEGVIQGVYTSHTGSTGSSVFIGQVDQNASIIDSKGIPFALGVQWRLINVDQADADGSWHWVSTFSGQYHPAQEISSPNQQPYNIPETLEILNGLIATATVPGFNDTAPLMWPQTLRFHRALEPYCEISTPATPVAYTPTAQDHISGDWLIIEEQEFSLDADLSTGIITGSYENLDGEIYDVYGRFDTLAPPVLFDVSDPDIADLDIFSDLPPLHLWDGEAETLPIPQAAYTVAMQGLVLSAKQVGVDNPKVKMFAGGVLYGDTNKMRLWESNLTSTTWTNRFTQETLNIGNFEKVSSTDEWFYLERLSQ